MNRREIHPPTVQPLCDCIAQGDLESVRRLLDADSSLVNAIFFQPGEDRPNRPLDIAVRIRGIRITPMRSRCGRPLATTPRTAMPMWPVCS